MFVNFSFSKTQYYSYGGFFVSLNKNKSNKKNFVALKTNIKHEKNNKIEHKHTIWSDLFVFGCERISAPECLIGIWIRIYIFKTIFDFRFHTIYLVIYLSNRRSIDLAQSIPARKMFDTRIFNCVFNILSKIFSCIPCSCANYSKHSLIQWMHCFWSPLDHWI